MSQMTNFYLTSIYFLSDKGGCELNQVSALSLFVRDQCPNLKIMGLMTIGSVGNSNSPLLEENPDFKV